MEARPNAERSATRYAPYVVELHEFFKSHGTRFGHPDDVKAFAAELGTAGAFHDEMMSMARAIIFREGGVVPRNELLALILVAVGGPETDETRKIDSAGAVEEFVVEVMQSFKRRSFVEDEVEDEDGKLVSPLEAVGIGSEAEEEVFLSAPRIERNNTKLEDDRVDLHRSVREQQPVASTFARAQLRSAVEWEESHLNGGLHSPLGTAAKPRILDASGLAVVAKALDVKPSDPFFRNVMFALAICLICVVMWRHWHPVVVPGGEGGVPLVASSRISSPAEMGDERAAAGADRVAASQKAVGASTGLRVGSDFRPDVRGREAAREAGAVTNLASVVPAIPTNSGSVALGSTPPPPVRRRAPRPATSGAVQAGNAGPTNATTQPGAFLVSSGVMSGNLISAPTPKYPKMAGMTGVEGQVILQAVVSSNGTVVATHVLDGHHMLRGAPAHAVRGWRYRPYMVNGKPTDVATIVIVEFHLPH